MSVIKKPWGEEIILTSKELPYVAKILKIKSGKRLSLQYHDSKTETLTLFEGGINLIKGNSQSNLETINMQKFQGYHILPHTIHRLEATKDSIVFEASTPEKGTTFRLSDDYQRTDETESIRNLSNRGWTKI